MTALRNPAVGPVVPPRPPAPSAARGGHALTPARTHTRTPGSGATSAAAGVGLPSLKSTQEVQAEANATAWKSIQKMMGTLPTFSHLDQPYSAQRAAIQPLVDAHRDWLLKAGNYSTQVTNGLAQLVGGAGQAADAHQAGISGLAGVPGGAPSTNVSPAQMSMGVLAPGGSTANYLQSLLPFATAQGIGNVGKVNAAEQAAVAKLQDAKQQISGQYGDLTDKAFNALDTSYFNKYKSELAAIYAGGTTAAKTAALGETKRYHNAQIKLAKQRIGAASDKASAATTAASDKAFAAQNKADRSLTVKALADARKVYDTQGGVKTSSGAPGSKKYGVTLTLYGPKPVIGSPTKQTYVVYGNTLEEAVHKANLKKAGQRPDTTDPSNQGYWSTSAAKPITTGSSSSGSAVKNRPSLQTRRMNAWRTFAATLTQLNSPLSTADMQALFRRQFGDPGKK